MRSSSRRLGRPALGVGQTTFSVSSSSSRSAGMSARREQRRATSRRVGVEQLARTGSRPPAAATPVGRARRDLAPGPRRGPSGVSGAIRPVCSATAMNRPGSSSPARGAASAPAPRRRPRAPVRRSTLRLVVQHELVGVDARAAARRPAPSCGGRSHRGRAVDGEPLPRLFAAVHRDVGAAAAGLDASPVAAGRAPRRCWRRRRTREGRRRANGPARAPGMRPRPSSAAAPASAPAAARRTRRRRAAPTGRRRAARRSAARRRPEQHASPAPWPSASFTLLEAVEVEVEQGCGAVQLGGLREDLPERLVEVAPVRHAGQSSV